MYPKSIQRLINLFKKFPTVGPRTAARFVFYLIKLPQDEFKELSSSIQDLRNNVKICSLCFNSFEDPQENICFICRDNSRNKEMLCIVEKEADLESIEKTKKYKGLYFILGGTLSLKKDNKKKLRIEELKNRIKNSEFKEIIIATNPTTEGETTALLIERSLAPLNIFVTRLGRGLPVGGELEYADDETLENALNSRR